MRWKRIRAETADQARAFLVCREARCVAAAARFRELEAGGDWGKSALWLGFEGAEARSLLFFSANGVLYPVLDAPADAANRRALVKMLLLPRRIRSVQATAAETAAADAAIAASPLHLVPGAGPGTPDSVDYVLMNLGAPPRAEALAAGPPGLRVCAAGIGDADALFPLQAAYELEEVVPAGGAFTPAACRLGLERALRSERAAVCAELDGTIIAKAGINARGFAYDQIGGVFVVPELRGAGIGTRLVAELCARMAAEGRRLSLFVKKRNAAARRAYEKIGFGEAGDYRITYYL